MERPGERCDLLPPDPNTIAHSILRSLLSADRSKGAKPKSRFRSTSERMCMAPLASTKCWAAEVFPLPESPWVIHSRGRDGRVYRGFGVPTEADARDLKTAVWDANIAKLQHTYPPNSFCRK
jgi:hypothetical protein